MGLLYDYQVVLKTLQPQITSGIINSLRAINGEGFYSMLKFQGVCCMDKIQFFCGMQTDF